MLYPSVFINDFADDFFNDFFAAPMKRVTYGSNSMRTDIKELDDSYELDVQLPGYNKEDVEVEIKNGYLTVRANHTENTEDKEDGKYIRKECYTGSCERSYYVGDKLTSDDVKANFANGVLQLTVPKEDKLPEREQKQLVQIEG
mgnify:FL=1